MDDLISRQAAINTVRKAKDRSEAHRMLIQLPSTQPGEDIRAMCGECDAWNQYKNYPPLKWIPCTPETMPEKEGRYVCTYIYDGKKDVFMFRYEDGDWLVPWYVEAITAWYKPLDPWEGEM